MWSILKHLICQSRILEVNFPPGMSVMGFFVKFLISNENDIIDILVADTNLYAQKQIAMKSWPPRIFGSYTRIRNWIPVTRNDVLSFLGIVWSMGIINKPTFEPNKVLNLVYCRLRCPTLDRNRFLHIHIRVVRLLGYTHKGVYKFLDNFLILFSWTYFVWAQNYFFNLHCLHLFMLNMIPSNYIGW